ncbi:hypothetical protein HanXRQr2_Chr10g0419181 [Helianthus annuus]|uniref:Uncharacterized protein n=1 Tax=Helianthus annuus TaxID=4232 RepID=A0A9K3HUK8_HELAN|nr:hypothetical protein HanXRQr2_Chr10g0419181 [Helianthus annuus]KAJ0882074.1 hypothetical protein HanPSC8_Chr10g0405371 [Helianthus annuus]
MINLQTLSRPMMSAGLCPMPPTTFLTITATPMPTNRTRPATPDPLHRPSTRTQTSIPECSFSNGFRSNFPGLLWIHGLFVQECEFWKKPAKRFSDLIIIKIGLNWVTQQI